MDKTWKWKLWFYVVGLSTLTASAILMNLLIASSWNGGDTGRVVLEFNRYGEQLIEQILLPLTTVWGVFAMIALLFYYVDKNRGK